jgi:Mce-associated membrane protein
VTQAVQTLFSFDYSDPGKTAAAVPGYLTGQAVSQYAALMTPVESHAADLKLELTTTVTSAGVQTLEGDRARVLVFVDQNDTSSATAGTSESSVAFAVEALRVGGTWKIAGIDTLGA